jgi:serine/threonine-protein kinase
MVKEALIATIAITLFLGVTVFSPALAQSDLHGAIAYSPATGKLGRAADYGTREEAEREALRQCDESDCKVYSWFMNSCGVLARGDDGAIGWSWDVDIDQAAEKAIRQCRDAKGVNCKPIAGGCTTKQQPQGWK